MTDLNLPLGVERKSGKKRWIALGLVAGLAAGASIWKSEADQKTAVVEAETLEEQIALEGYQIAFSAARHNVDRSLMHGINASEIAAKTERVPPEVAVFDGKKVTIAGVLQRNESVFAALEARNVNPVSIQEVVVATSEEFNFRKKSRPGDKWRAEVLEDGTVNVFRYETSPEHIWEATRDTEGGYSIEKLDVPVETKIGVAGGKIKSTLWQALADSSAGSEFVVDFINLFAYSIDFGTETKVGDEFALVFEKIYLDGEFLRYGDVLAAYYKGEDSGETYGFQYTDKDGAASYYDEDGAKLEGQFLKSPLATVKITSTFGRRFHPVHKKYKQHAGVDYGAPTGTPVQAVATGNVMFAGRKGGYGNVVEIKHPNGFVTQYAHLSKISKGIKKGKKVTKKTVIGKVGQTGTATGPHLHFGMRKNGKYVNPLNMNFAKGDSLKGKELEQYEEKIVLPMMMELRNQIASNPDG